MVVHKKVGQIKCQECGISLSTRFNFKRHMDSHLRDEAQRERERLTFRHVDLEQWDPEMEGEGSGSEVDGGEEGQEVGGRGDGQEISVEGQEVGEGSDIEDEPASDRRKGFSVIELADASVIRSY